MGLHASSTLHLSGEYVWWENRLKKYNNKWLSCIGGILQPYYHSWFIYIKLLMQEENIFVNIVFCKCYRKMSATFLCPFYALRLARADPKWECIPTTELVFEVSKWFSFRNASDQLHVHVLQSSFRFYILKVLFFAVSEQSCYITAHITCISSHTMMVFTNTSDCVSYSLTGERLGSAIRGAPSSCCLDLGSINATCFKRWFSSKYFLWFYAVLQHEYSLIWNIFIRGESRRSDWSWLSVSNMVMSSQSSCTIYWEGKVMNSVEILSCHLW